MVEFIKERIKNTIDAFNFSKETLLKVEQILNEENIDTIENNTESIKKYVK